MGPFPKVIREGKVAIVHNGDYGMNLYSTYPKHPELLFSPLLVELVESNRTYEITAEFLKREFGIEVPGNELMTSWINLQVTYLPIGTMFTIFEYDGKEKIITQDDLTFVA